MKENFLDTAEQILRFKSHRDLLVRKMVITMIPSLAAYDTQTFTEHFLHKAMGHLLTQLEKPNERSFGRSHSTASRWLPHFLLNSFHRNRTHCNCCWKRHEAISRFYHGANQIGIAKSRVGILFVWHVSYLNAITVGVRTHLRRSLFSNVLAC